MKPTNKTQVILSLLLVALSGAIVGGALTYGWMRRSAMLETQASLADGLSRFLSLDAEQARQARDIIDRGVRETAALAKGDIEGRARLRQGMRRDIQAILNPEQRQRYDRLQEVHDEKPRGVSSATPER